MRYRILTITFQSGGKNYYPQRLTLTGYKTLQKLSGDAVYLDYEKAEDHIQKHRARKFSHKYIW